MIVPNSRIAGTSTRGFAAPHVSRYIPRRLRRSASRLRIGDISSRRHSARSQTVWLPQSQRQQLNRLHMLPGSWPVALLFIRSIWKFATPMPFLLARMYELSNLVKWWGFWESTVALQEGESEHRSLRRERNRYTWIKQILEDGEAQPLIFPTWGRSSWWSWQGNRRRGSPPSFPSLAECRSQFDRGPIPPSPQSRDRASRPTEAGQRG